MKKLLLFGVLALSINAFGQSKKEQIVALNYSIDSLNTVLSTTRDKSSKDIQGLNSEIAQLKSDVSSLELSTTKLTKENEKLKLDLEEISKRNLELEAKLKVVNEKQNENKWISENDYNAIITNLSINNSGGSARNWLEKIVKNESIMFNDFMTKRCAEFAGEVSGYTLGFSETTEQDLRDRWGKDFDIRYAKWIHPFFGGQDTYGDTDIKSLEFLGMLNNGFWFKVESCNPNCSNSNSTKVVRIVKVIEMETGYLVDNFVSLSDD